MGSVASVLTGGVSDIIDVVQGDTPSSVAPIIDVLPESVQSTVESTIAPFIQSTLTGGISDAAHAISEGGSGYDIIDRAIDPGGTVNTGTRAFGEALPDELRQIAPALGTIIGTAIYPVAGTAAGYGVGSKIRGDTTEQGMQGAAIAGGTAYLNAAISDYLSNASVANPANSTYQFGGAEPVFNPGELTVDPSLAPGADVFSIDPNLAPSSVSGVNYFDVNPALELGPSEWSASIPQTQFQIGGATTPGNPYVFGSGVHEFITNPALDYSPAEAPFIFGGGARPFQVDTSLDPNAYSIPKDWLTFDNLVDAGKIMARLFNGIGGTGAPVVTTEEAFQGSASDLGDASNAMNYGSGIGRSKGLNSAAFGSMYTALSHPNLDEIKGYGDNTYYR